MDKEHRAQSRALRHRGREPESGEEAAEEDRGADVALRELLLDHEIAEPALELETGERSGDDPEVDPDEKRGERPDDRPRTPLPEKLPQVDLGERLA